ncbi:MAG: bifunctional diaminohydroxyphosphoribosylaminopyrimidine deaminase/5-amino-6-(5-phosphoribosylamino)uracil reductase RibD [Deltaproteobacteria bacterium]|nr:bifunctional diaminohydroxyphosphoribosylaminopyrimidine deaminase/5-amino-6-(5-phosphoribosylamino)uracil reductase RibD [Deltaproteobacteria bacterium]
MTDEFYMRQALKLAKRGEGRVSPNPMVGAVIVKGNRIIGKGYHQCCGENHAETNAVCNAKESIAGATIYVTLEPCSHHGRTPPCAEMLLAHKPARVVVGTLDPNPLVAGRGMDLLKKNGIATTVGVLAEECLKLNEKYFKFIQTRVPFVTLKYAQTLDGRIATAAGHSQWISSDASRRYAHTLRSVHDAVLVGAGTVIKDDPELTVRLVKGKNPLRVVVDSQLRTPPDAKIIKNQGDAATLIAITAHADRKKRAAFADLGVEILEIDEDRRGQVDLKALLRELGKRNIASVLVEGGSEIITAFFRDGLADRVTIITAPKIAGAGIEAVGDLGIRDMNHAIPIACEKILRRGGDFIMEGKIVRQDKE